MRIGINGFGRIGRAVARILSEGGRHEIVHINDINPDPVNMAYLWKYDSVYGTLGAEIRAEGDTINFDGRPISISHFGHIDEAPWVDRNVDVVVEATGVKDNEVRAKQFARASKLAIFSTNASEAADATLLFGVNEAQYDPARHRFVAVSICDANACAPVLKCLEDEFGIDHGYVTTLHPWLSYQNLVDGPSRSAAYPGATYSHYALGRSSVGTLIPKPTTVVSACARVLPRIEEKLQCMSFRVPTSIVSCADMMITVTKAVTREDVLRAIEDKVREQSRRIIRVSAEPLVSVDYVKDPHSAIIDSRWLAVNARHNVKLVLWYDNEWGYSSRVVDGIDLYDQLRS